MYLMKDRAIEAQNKILLLYSAETTTQMTVLWWVKILYHVVKLTLVQCLFRLCRLLISYEYDHNNYYTSLVFVECTELEVTPCVF